MTVDELGPLGAIGVSYDRSEHPHDGAQDGEPREVLIIRIDGEIVGSVSVPAEHRALPDLIVYALAGNGARERSE